MNRSQEKQKRLFWLAMAVLLVMALATGKQPVHRVEANTHAIQLSLAPFASGFSNPVKLTNAGDDRLFVVEQAGVIHVLDGNGNRLPDPFLDLTDRVESGGERGLLGLAFEPNNPATFYVNYTRKSTNNAERGDTIISRFNVLSGQPNRGDPDSEQIVLIIDQPFSNHNAGDLAFGPDGYLYIPMGDGGSGGDPQNRAQNLNELLGKVLRLDVVDEQTYVIPPDNPYANDGDPNTRAEIWSSGWRNPWRFSFDRATGEMYVGDVGQGAREEVSYEAANSPGGANYGWNLCEGNYVFPAEDPPRLCSTTDALLEPIFDYGRSLGTTVTGGFVYRGSAYPNMIGHYIFADFGSGRFWSLVRDDQDNWNATDHGQIGGGNPSTFGENSIGELFVASHGGSIFRVIDTSAPPETPTPTATNTLVPITPDSLTPQSYLPLVHKNE
jgi:glucose/arabinose dehydrogenase